MENKFKGEFVIRLNDELVTYEYYEDIPQEFDNVISFKIEPKEGDFEYTVLMQDLLKELLQRETK